MPNQPNLQDLAREVEGKLATLRDDVRVRLHLAGMDARDAWGHVETYLESVEGHLRRALGAAAAGESIDAEEELRAGLYETRQRLNELEPRLRELGSTIEEAGRSTLDALREALTDFDR